MVDKISDAKLNLFFGRDEDAFWVIQEGKVTREYVSEREWFALLDMARVTPPEARQEPIKLTLTIQATVEKFDGEYEPGKPPVETITGDIDVAEIQFGS